MEGGEKTVERRRNERRGTKGKVENRNKKKQEREKKSKDQIEERWRGGGRKREHGGKS